MQHKDFTIDQEFLCGGKRWRCTDVGTRTIVAICLSETNFTRSSDVAEITFTLTYDQAEADGWFDGPPYAVEEIVFDENDVEGCEAA